MTTRRKIFAGLALAAVAAVAGCLDALAPGAAHRVGSIGIVPVFEGAAARDGLPADVDSIVVTIHNPSPPPPDTTVGVHVEPGQDSIVITIEVPLSTAASDDRTRTFQALSSDGTVLYSGTSDVTVKAGIPTTADSVRVVYVGPGQNIRSLVLSPRSIGLKPGDTFSAWLVTAFDSAGATILTMPPVLWHSLDPGTATIDALGVVRGVAVGHTWLFATSAASSAIYDSALVVVSTTPVGVIALAPGSATFSATVGGANPAAQTIAVTNSGVGALGGLAVGTITYGASETTGWLTATLNQATAPATLTLQPATGSLAAGTYHATVPVTSAAASNSPQTVAVTFTVAAGPAIGLASTSLTFTATAGGADPASQPIAVTNSGGGALTGLAVGTINYGSGSGWLTATLDSTHAPATLTVHAATGALAPGSYTATIPVTSPVASNSPRTVSVTFTVAAGATIGLSSAAVTFTDTLTTSDPAAQTVSVTNTGGGALTGLTVGTINYGSGSGWLTAVLSQATAPATLTLTVAKGALGAGTYTATVPIASAVATNSPQTVTVTFTIAAGPAIGLSAAAVTFTDTMTTPDPAAQTVSVTNSGGGALTGLAVGTINYGSGSGWLTAVLDQATAPATLTLTVAKGALTPGTYTATVPVTSAAAGNTPQNVAVTFTIAPMPLIGLAPTAVIFSDTLLTADPASRTVAVTNAGGGTLAGLAVGTINYGSGSGWLTAVLDQAAAPAMLTLTVAKGALTPGTYAATVPITSGVAGNTPQNVAVTFTIAPMPLIGLAPAAVTFADTLLTADPASRTVAVTNAGGGTLAGLAVGTINYGSGSGWLAASLDVTTAPATLTLTVAKGALTAGSYTASVPISAGFAGNSPQSVAVTFIVAPVPLVRMVLTPGFGIVQPAGTLPLAVQGFDAASVPVPANGLRYLSRTPAVATVDSLTGVVTAVTGGSAVVVASAPGASGSVYDSTLVAVPTTGVAVALPVSNGRAFGVANVGDTVHVVVAVNIGALPGDSLGSYNAQLNWSSSVLHYVSTAPAAFAAPVLNETATASGQLRFSAASPSGAAGPMIVLVDVKFVAGATGQSPLTFALSELYSSRSPYADLLPPAIVLSGGVRVK